MSNIVPGVSLTPLCFPDITSKTTRLFATVNFGYGLQYTTGGIPAGLLAFADANTVNADGFPVCQSVGRECTGHHAVLVLLRSRH